MTPVLMPVLTPVLRNLTHRSHPHVQDSFARNYRTRRRPRQCATGGWDIRSVEVSLANQDVRCLAADPTDPHVVYAGTQGAGVLRSDDGGQTWRQAGLAGRIVKSLVRQPRRARHGLRGNETRAGLCLS